MSHDAHDSSKEAALPPLEISEEQRRSAYDHHDKLPHAFDINSGNYARLLCRERQLREALTQNAALTKQVEELQADLARGLNVEFQRTICCVCGVYKHTPVRNDDLGGYICGG